MERRTNELVKELEEIPLWEQVGEQQISWDTAVEMALKQNLELKRARLAVEDAERSVSRVFLDMIPGINLDAMITEDVNKFDSISSGDVEYNTNIVFNFPSITKVPLQYYTAKATEFRAKKSIAMKEREVISKLYKNAKDAMAAADAYSVQKSSISFADDGMERSNIEKMWQEKRKALSSDLASTLGNIQKRWSIIPSTVPKFNWSRYQTASKKLDFLVVSMMAMEMEASNLNKLGIKMQWFPELNVNFYSPSLFSSTAGTYGGVYASSDDMKINMALSWRLDTQLRVWHQWKSAKGSHEILVEEIRIRMIERREKVKALIRSMEEYSVWKGYRSKRIAYLQNRQPMNFEEQKKNFLELKELSSKASSEETENIEREAALILEYGLL